MPGDQVLRRLRADPATSDIPVVILSADATQRHMSQLMTVGADAYLTKPISVRGLLHAVDLAIGEAVTPAPRPPGQASRGDSHLSPAAPRHTSRGAATLAPQPHDTQAAER
jgi:DNA-binding response OmpR family regulator